MKKSFLLTCALAIVLMASCGPSRHAVQVEMRYPSKAGVDLADKLISVVCLENGNPYASSFNEAIASGFASALEKEYNTGEGSVGVYRMRHLPGGVYSSRDSLVNLLMDTGADVVFLLDTLSLGTMTVAGATRAAVPLSADSAYVSSGNVKFSMQMYCFDAMDKSGKVRTFTGTSFARPDVYSNGKESPAVLLERAYNALEEEGIGAGEAVAASFGPEWKLEQYSITYFDGVKWYDAIAKASEYDWKGAMDLWFGLLDSNNLMKRSCAEYNIAVACLMLGDASLASQWLDRSDEDSMLPLSETLRKRINARLQ